MELEILNEILTTTVGSLFEVPFLKTTLKPRDGRSLGGSNEGNSQKINQNNAKNDGMKENEPKKKIEDVLDIWVINEGPKLFQESLRRLKIDINRLTRKEMEKMSYEKLNQEKKKIKVELKNYDLTFKGAFKRFPLKSEKEPMRPLYIYYKTIKELLVKHTQGLKKMDDENSKIEKKESVNSLSSIGSSSNSSCSSCKSARICRFLFSFRLWNV